MPAVALVGAAASVSAGMAAGGLIGGLMVAGGVATGLGALTGNKKLTSFGALLGVAGGVAGLANGSWSSSAQSVAESASSAGAVNGLDAASDLFSATGASVDGVTAGLMGSEVASSAAAVNGMDFASDQAAGLINQPFESAPAFNPAKDSAAAYQDVFTPQSGIGLTPGAKTGLQAQGSVGIQPGGLLAQAGDKYDTLFGSMQGNTSTSIAEKLSRLDPGVTQDKSFIESAVKWAKTNPELAKVISGVVQGGATAYGQYEAKKFEQGLLDAKRNRINQSIVNLNVPRYGVTQ